MCYEIEDKNTDQYYAIKFDVKLRNIVTKSWNVVIETKSLSWEQIIRWYKVFWDDWETFKDEPHFNTSVIWLMNVYI